MQKIFLFIAALALVGAGCANNVQTQVEVDGASDVSLRVPAPGFEDIEEMIVEDSEDAEVVDTEADVDVEADVETGDAEANEPPQEQVSPPEPVLVTVVAKAWQFEPSTIRVKEGQRVDLQIVSIDVDHGFNLAAFGVNERLEPGKTVRVSFVADKKGSFPFFCNVFCGDGHGGMRGTLIVE